VRRLPNVKKRIRPSRQKSGEDPLKQVETRIWPCSAPIGSCEHYPGPMDGPEILARSMTATQIPDKFGNLWQYHPRSDRHSKVACWAAFFDLLSTSALLRAHVADGKVVFGINHTMRDFRTRRKKDLDLVIARPGTEDPNPITRDKTLSSLADYYGVLLTDAQAARLAELPEARGGPVGNVLVALEAKACMTKFSSSRPRLYDELNSSHLTIHGASAQAAAAALVTVNVSPEFISPDRNKVSLDGRVPDIMPFKQPAGAASIVEKITEIPRRSSPNEEGFDSIGIIMLNCRNDGSEISVVRDSPAPPPSDDFHYDQMIRRLGHIYDSRFQHI
jgi:hypothetical protein